MHHFLSGRPVTHFVKVESLVCEGSPIVAIGENRQGAGTSSLYYRTKETMEDGEGNEEESKETTKRLRRVRNSRRRKVQKPARVRRETGVQSRRSGL